MSRPLKKLFDLEIDEVSVVDRPANQHGLISFSKSLGEGGEETVKDDVLLFDEDGDEVDVDLLEHGDVVYDVSGDEFVFVEDDEFGKADTGELALEKGKHVLPGAKPEPVAREGETRVIQPWQYAYKKFKNQIEAEKNASNWTKAKRFAKRPGVAAGLGAAAGATAIGGYNAMSKSYDEYSYGDYVLEELSKSVSIADRDEVIAKAMDEVEFAKAAAEEAWAYAAGIEDARIKEAFISKAAEYNLPVAPEVFGPILKSMAETLSDEELMILDEIFSAVGDALYEEIGYIGDTDNSSVLSLVDAYSDELVGKADVSRAEAMTAMFMANPTAYDAYLAENGR